MSEGGEAPASGGIIDLRERLAGMEGVSYEPPFQMRERLEREKLQLRHQLEQEKLEKQHGRDVELGETKHRRWVFWTIFAAVLVVGVVAMWIGFFDGSSTSEAQAWARTTASAIVGGLVGYFTGAGLAPK